MLTHGPDASSTTAAEPLYIIDDGPLTEEDIEAIRAFLDDPVGVTEDGELDRMSPEAVLAVRAELDALAASRG
jgi:hypothetical protein